MYSYAVFAPVRLPWQESLLGYRFRREEIGVEAMDVYP